VQLQIQFIPIKKSAVDDCFSLHLDHLIKNPCNSLCANADSLLSLLTPSIHDCRHQYC